MQSFDWPVYLADEEKIIFWCLPFFTFYRCAVCKPTTGLNYSANIRKTDWRLENHTRKWPDWGHVVKCIHADLLKAISLRTSNFKPAKGCTATVLSQLPNNLTLLWFFLIISLDESDRDSVRAHRVVRDCSPFHSLADADRARSSGRSARTILSIHQSECWPTSDRLLIGGTKDAIRLELSDHWKFSSLLRSPF